MHKLIIIRGLPGSGKTTFAHTLTTHVFEADQYFTDSNGIYTFDREKLSEAHHWCQAQVISAMIADAPIIAVSNTFVRKWEKKVYLDLARIYGYQVTEITMTNPLRPSIHGVPDEVIERMKTQWDT